MKRRMFGLLAGVSTLTLMIHRTAAQSANPAQLLTTTLTPMGAERAGNAAGTIPAWTGGMTSMPAGFVPQPGMEPDYFAADKPLYTVDATNMAQYSDVLTEGVKRLIQKTGFSLQVYATRRTAAAPQWVYDNIAANATRANLLEPDGRTGFTGGYGGIPFPIPNVTEPLSAGAQIMWNHLTRWNGTYFEETQTSYAVENGRVAVSAGGPTDWFYPYYDPKGSVATYAGYQAQYHAIDVEPETIVGQQLAGKYSGNSLIQPNITWELLLGQGRVRKAPEVAYDTPDSNTDGIANYDEYYCFNGAIDRYNWRCVGKKEMLIPYNNNGARRTPHNVAFGPKFINPAIVRWELHRVWVIEATLHPGERNVLAHRRVYVDEDTWNAAIVDAYDAGGLLYKLDMNTNEVHPNLPGVIILHTLCYNLQTGDYTCLQGPWGDGPDVKPILFKPFPASELQPQAMAATASY